MAQKTKAERKSDAMPKRIIAVIFWLLGIACEVVAIMVLSKYFYVSNQMAWLIGLIIADLVLVIIGSQFWKKANHIDPAPAKDKTRFFIQNQMGLIVSVIAFFPIILFLLKDKELDKKTKKIVTAVAAAALVICSLFSIDFDPLSEEEYNQLTTELDGETVIWTTFGKSYHLDPNCRTLQRSKEENIHRTDITTAIEAGRDDPCDFCALGH